MLAMSFAVTTWSLFLIPVVVLGASLFWGAPIIALVSELAAAVSKRPLPLRLAQQQSRLALVIHPALWAAVGAIFWVALPEVRPRFEAGALPWTTVILAAAGSCLTMAWALTWNLARQRRGFHIVLGCAANMCLKYGYWGIVLLVSNASPETIPWALASLWPVAALFGASCCGPVYLVLRRNADDWGRDYYRYSARVLGRWVAGTAVLLAAGMSWAFMAYHKTANLFLPPLFFPAMAAAGLLACCALMGLVLARAEHPMRHKIVMAGIWAAGLGAIALLVLAVAEGVSHYVPGWNILTPLPDLLQHLGW
jgi:hypothetical protein